MNILSNKDYENKKTDFLKSHDDWHVETSPMDNDGQLSISVNDLLVNKESGTRFTVLSINVTKDKNKNLELSYSISRINGIYVRTIPYETLKYYYWKII